MKEVTVIGSCVCRDLFEKDNGENYLFKTDIRFSSPISMLSNPVKFAKAGFEDFPKKVKVVGTNWYKKNLINDINKTAFDALKEKHGEYLILDFAESRIPLVKIRWKGKNEELIVTHSVTFKGHYDCNLSKNVFKNTSLEIVNPMSYDDNFWKKTIKSFSEKILELFDEDKIILIKNMPAKYYVDIKGCLHPYSSANHFYEICTCDLLINKLNEYFVQNCPRCKIIDIPNNCVGVQNHKWGNHPFHFSNSYYEYLFRCVNKIILNNEPLTIGDLYNYYSSVFNTELLEAKTVAATKNFALDSSSYISDLLNQYEEFNALGMRKQLAMYFLFDKKHFVGHLKKALREK